MDPAVLLWALWVVGGGPVNSGFLVTQPQVAAYFSTREECERVQAHVRKGVDTAAWRRMAAWSQYIQGRYVLAVK